MNKLSFLPRFNRLAIRISVAATPLLLASTLTAAETFVVNSTGDSGPGSLRHAIESANASPGIDLIAFDIPGPGPHTLQPFSELPHVLDPVVIDGSTQPGFAGAPLIELDGQFAGAPANGLTIVAGDSHIRALAINRFTHSGIALIHYGGNRVQGCYLGTDLSGTIALGNYFGITVQSTDSIIGGTEPGSGNLISGNLQHGIALGGSDHRVVGNLIGTDISGTQPLPNGSTGVKIDHGRAILVGGRDPGARNVISGNTSYGISIAGAGADSNRIQGNYIGTDKHGITAVGNHAGIIIQNGIYNLVGGPDPGSGNLISGNHVGVDLRSRHNVVQGNFIGTDRHGASPAANVWGLYLADDAKNNLIGGSAPGEPNLISGNWRAVHINHAASTGNVLQGNFIGTDISGRSPLSNFEGVWITDGASQNLIGGTEPNAGNLIAFNEASGVTVGGFPSPVQNAIRGNSIHSNGWLGIDLIAPDEPIVGWMTPNDLHDADAGSNGLQNFPEIHSATLTPNGVVLVRGALHSTPESTFQIEFFANAKCDASSYGEGELFLGSKTVMTDRTGYAQFHVPFSIQDPARPFITATATDLLGNTSEFSLCKQLAPVGRPSNRK